MLTLSSHTIKDILIAFLSFYYSSRKRWISVWTRESTQWLKMDCSRRFEAFTMNLSLKRKNFYFATSMIKLVAQFGSKWLLYFSGKHLPHESTLFLHFIANFCNLRLACADIFKFAIFKSHSRAKILSKFSEAQVAHAWSYRCRRRRLTMLLHSFLTVLYEIRASINPNHNLMFNLFYLFANSSVDYEEGVLQTIGFKEFIPYLKSFDKSHDTLINRFVEAPETTSEPNGWKSLVACLDELKLVTRRYSRKQQKWIRNRFLGSEVREVPLIYPLNTSDVDRWKELVSQPAEEVVSCYINDEEIQLKPLEKHKKISEGLNEETSQQCEVCNRTFIGEFQWQLHQKSNRHKRALAGKLRREKKESLNENTSS